ncbi:hypothetical protein J6590_032687 [Homalodisca vitripennis]|nr:hypothetical protein J6590_032687 [Homalodisca vitripennis]
MSVLWRDYNEAANDRGGLGEALPSPLVVRLFTPPLSPLRHLPLVVGLLCCDLIKVDFGSWRGPLPMLDKKQGQLSSPTPQTDACHSICYKLVSD